mgnify:CR=1 FL=1
MKIIKPVLLGPKLIAVGPLKCFKGGGGGSSGGGGGGGGGGGKGGGGGSSSSSSGSKGGSPSPSPKKPDTPKPAEPEKKEEKEEEKSGFAGFMDTITGGDAAEARRLGMSTQEYQQAVEDAGPGTGLFGRTEGDIRSAAEARRTGEIRDAAPISDEVLKEAEAREKAKEDLEERNKALEQEKLEAEQSPFTKQLAGVDLKKAEFAGKMRQTPLEERQRLAQEEIDKLGSDRIEEAKKKQMQEMSFLDRLTGKKPGFQAARVGPEEIEAIERKYQVDEVEDPGSKALDEFQQSDQFKETLQRERGLLAQNKALEAQQAAEERKTLERELAQRRPRPELAEPEVSPFTKQLTDKDIAKAVQGR